MPSTLSHSPALDLDPKRIAANSATIALHVVAFMLLLAPTEAPPAAPVKETTILVNETRRLPPPLPPPPPQQPDRPLPRQNTAPIAVATQEPVTDISAPIDEGLPPAIDDPPLPTTFEDTGPGFVQLQTDVAPAPPYPPMALKRGLQGTVVLRVLVDSSGRPLEVSIEQSSGTRLLDEAAQKFIRARWHFVPARLGGNAVEAYVLVPVNFSIAR